jgi:hypothetical protein
MLLFFAMCVHLIWGPLSHSGAARSNRGRPASFTFAPSKMVAT